MNYIKDHFTIDEQIEKIKSDGFIISNEVEFKILLGNLNYYKLKGYIYSIKEEYKETIYENKIDIQEVIDIYSFDEKLRTFLFEILEKIEVSIKSKIANKLGEEIGAFGYLDPLNFNTKIDRKYYDHSKFLTNLKSYQKRSKEDFMNHYRRKYLKEEYTPLWIMIELLPFGDLSRFYEAYKKNKKVSREYDLRPDVLSSLLHRLSFIRNICAHNSRIWNIQFKNRIKLKKGWENHQWQRLEGTIFVMNYLIKKSKIKYDFKLLYQHIDDFIKKYPNKSIYMGIKTTNDLDFLLEE